MNITFRRMQPEDAQQVFELEKQIFKDAWPIDSFLSEIENKKISYPFLMLNEKDIIGYAVIISVADEIHINNFAVTPGFRRKGYGRKLMQHILDKYTDHQDAFLEVRPSNVAAIALYEKFNFKQIYLRKAYYADGEDALIMQRDFALD